MSPSILVRVCCYCAHARTLSRKHPDDSVPVNSQEEDSAEKTVLLRNKASVTLIPAPHKEGRRRNKFVNYVKA